MTLCSWCEEREATHWVPEAVRRMGFEAGGMCPCCKKNWDELENESLPDSDLSLEDFRHGKM